MAKNPKHEQDNDDREAIPDAWASFERAVDAAVKSGPKHRRLGSTSKVKHRDDADDKRDNSDRVSNPRGR